MAEDLNILVEETGQVKLLSPKLTSWLAQRSGLWQLVPTAENLLVFNRLGSESQHKIKGGRTGTLQLTGSVTAMGGLMDVITFLHNAKRSGALVVLSNDVKKTLFFADGDVRLATSNVPEDRLGALLYRFGMITPQQLKQALGRVGRGRKLGRVLIEMEVITAHELYTIIRRQVEEIFFSVLLIRTGVFYFYTLDGEQHVPAQINLDTQNLLLQGVKRIDEMSYFRERIPHKDIVVEIRHDITPKKLDEKQTLIYNLIDGMRSIDEIARESRLGEFETTKLVFHLMQLGYVQRRRDTDITRLSVPTERRDRPAAHAALMETFNTVFRKIFATVQSKGKEPVLRQGLDSFFEGATGFVELFAGSRLDEDGALPEDVILRNLDRVNVQNKMDFLYNGLNELLFFEMFTAGETLPIEDEERLQDQINAIFRESSR